MISHSDFHIIDVFCYRAGFLWGIVFTHGVWMGRRHLGGHGVTLI